MCVLSISPLNHRDSVERDCVQVDDNIGYSIGHSEVVNGVNVVNECGVEWKIADDMLSRYY